MTYRAPTRPEGVSFALFLLRSWPLQFFGKAKAKRAEGPQCRPATATPIFGNHRRNPGAVITVLNIAINTSMVRTCCEITPRS